MKSSAALPLSRQLLVVAAALLLLISGVEFWAFRSGYILQYGDAQAHLNISRSIVDSRTPGYDQLGSVWLPVLHVLCLPLVGNTYLWSTGLAGAIPVSLCFVLAGMLFYAAASDAYRDWKAAAAVVCCFAFNPNLLCLAVAPMTEVVFIAGLAAFLLALGRGWLALGIAACWWMALTRYDGWFLIPFAAAAFGWKKRSLPKGMLFAALAALAPGYWLAHNWYETSNAFDFFNGPYSALAIQGARLYPGFHNWPQAIYYYATAGQVCSGWGLILCGLVGFFCISNARLLLPNAFLLLTPLFYIWSLHGSGTPIFLPQLEPHSYYNSRYGIAVTVWCSFATGALLTCKPLRERKWSTAVVILFAAAPWFVSSRDSWVVWKESEVNSRARMVWTRQAANYLRSHYRPGQGITAPFSDVTGIFCRAGISLREVLHEGNGPLWYATWKRPDLIHTTEWAVSQQKPYGPAYELADQFDIKGAPPLQIWKRTDSHDRDSIPQAPRRRK